MSADKVSEVQSQIVKNLWATGSYSISSVANLVGVSEDFVLEVVNS